MIMNLDWFTLCRGSAQLVWGRRLHGALYSSRRSVSLNFTFLLVIAGASAGPEERRKY